MSSIKVDDTALHFEYCSELALYAFQNNMIEYDE